MPKPSTPAGRPSAALYRRRRTALVLGALILVALVLALTVLLRPGSSRGEGTASATSGPSTASAHPASAKPKPVRTPVPTARAAAPDGSPCTAATVTVTAITNATAYAAGQKPQLSLSLTNTGPNTCVIDAGTAAQVYTITSGQEVYWRSTDCQTGATSTKILLEPGKTLTSTPIPWDRTRSAKGTCEGTRPMVPAGGASYHLGVSVDGIAAKRPVQFLLR